MSLLDYIPGLAVEHTHTRRRGAQTTRRTFRLAPAPVPSRRTVRQAAQQPPRQSWLRYFLVTALPGLAPFWPAPAPPVRPIRRRAVSNSQPATRNPATMRTDTGRRVSQRQLQKQVPKLTAKAKPVAVAAHENAGHHVEGYTRDAPSGPRTETLARWQERAAWMWGQR